MVGGSIKFLVIALILASLPFEATCGTGDDCEDPYAFIDEKAMEDVVYRHCRLRFNDNETEFFRTTKDFCATHQKVIFPDEDSTEACTPRGNWGYNISDNCFHHCFFLQAGFVVGVNPKGQPAWPHGVQIPDWYVIPGERFNIETLHTDVEESYRNEMVEAWNVTCFHEAIDTLRNKICFEKEKVTDPSLHDTWLHGTCAMWNYFACCVNRELNRIQDQCYGDYLQKYERRGWIDP